MAVGQPDVSDVHVNGLLTQLSIAHYNEPNSYIADKVFPLIYVPKRSDIYPVYDRGFFFADEGTALLRAPGTKAARAGFAVTVSNTYTCENYAVGFPIPDELRANQDDPFDMDRDGTRLITELLMIRRERAFAADFMATSVWGGDRTGTTDFTKWNDVTSDPIAEIRLQKRNILSRIGRMPNNLIMGQITWDRLLDHPDILDRIKGGATAENPAFVNQQLVASLLGLDRILVGSAIYRSSAEGAALTLAPILDDDALLLYVPAAASILAPAGGYTFVWESMVAGRNAPQFIRKYREGPEGQDVLESHTWFDQVATEPQAGVFFTDAVD